MTELRDRAARQLAVTEFTRPVILEAGAGTGKTSTLVARIGTWLLGPGWEQAREELAAERAARGAAAPEARAIADRVADTIAAITFTEAAAAEMASRVGQLLAGAADGKRPKELVDGPLDLTAEELAARGRQLLAAAGRLRISTIHGFCHALLAERPLEAGLHPSFQVDADGAEVERHATAILVERLRAGDETLVRLLTAGISPPTLLDALATLATEGVTGAELAVDPFDAASLEPLYAGLAGSARRVRALAAPLAAEKRLRSLPGILAALDGLAGALEETAPSVAGLTALAPTLESATRALAKTRDWAAGRFGSTESAALDPAARGDLETASVELAERLPALAGLDPELFDAARRGLAAPLEELRKRLRAEGVLSFGDLLERAVDLLTRRPSVLAAVRRGLRQLLVDEFQDTDERQCDLLRRIALAESDGPAPGLFVVGDPKQSIYGWRSADLAAYVRFLGELDAVGAARGRLEVNFRSSAAILAEVERSLADVLVEEPGLQAGFEPLIDHPEREPRDAIAAGRAAVEYWRIDDLDDGSVPGAGPAARIARIEAEAIAADLRELGGPDRWGRFAILLRSRSDLELHLDALRCAGVPYAVAKDRSYFRRREVVDAAAAVRATIDPTDLLALVAFLRSPFVGVPDAAWLPLWRAGFPAALVDLADERGLDRVREAITAAASGLPADVPELEWIGAWEVSLGAAVESIAALRRELGELSPVEWVERFRARFAFEPLAASRFLGRFAVANLERLFDDLVEALSREPDPMRVLAALRRSVAEGAEAEEARPPGESTDAVSVMTIHGAKGLEFAHVYLPQVQRRTGGPRGGRQRPAEAGPPAPRRALRLFGAPSPDWAAHEREAARRAEAEAARLLYVATTRAAERLVVSGAWGAPGRADRSAPPAFAELIGARLASEPAERPAIDADGTLWRSVASLAGAPPAPDDAAPARPAVEPPGRALGERRERARRRAARPRLATVSRSVDAEAGGSASAGDRAAARALGTALHRALELAPLARADEAAWRAAAAASFAAERGASAEALGPALDRLLASTLWRRLGELEPHVVARELPILVSVGDVAAGVGEPTDGWVGTVDLLYRDPEDGAWVVADFKSDAVEASEVEAKLETYRPQLELYGRAVREALELETSPRRELWLLGLDRIELLAGASGAPQTE